MLATVSIDKYGFFHKLSMVTISVDFFSYIH